MTGTSTRTPTTVARATVLFCAQERDGHGNRQFIEVGGPYHLGRSRNVVLEFEGAAGQIGDEEDEKGLQNQWHCDQEDVQRIFQDHPTLEGEEDEQGQQQSHASPKHLTSIKVNVRMALK